MFMKVQCCLSHSLHFPMVFFHILFAFRVEVSVFLDYYNVEFNVKTFSVRVSRSSKRICNPWKVRLVVTEKNFSFQVLKERPFNARKKFKYALLCVRAVIRLNRLKYIPERVTIELSKSDPYRLKALRKVSSPNLNVWLGDRAYGGGFNFPLFFLLVETNYRFSKMDIFRGFWIFDFEFCTFEWNSNRTENVSQFRGPITRVLLQR